MIPKLLLLTIFITVLLQFPDITISECNAETQIKVDTDYSYERKYENGEWWIYVYFDSLLVDIIPSED